jgi:hypothetical protein
VIRAFYCLGNSWVYLFNNWQPRDYVLGDKMEGRREKAGREEESEGAGSVFGPVGEVTQGVRATEKWGNKMDE